MEQGFITTVLPKLGLRYLREMTKPPLWFSYDSEGDAVHLIFEEANKSDKATLEKDDVIVTKRGKKIINMTVLHVSRFVH